MDIACAAPAIGLQEGTMATINGTSNSETLKGGAGNDLITGFAGNDRALMGGGNDVFIWNVGDGKDTIEGGAGVDTLRLFDSDKGETFELSANGARTRLSRMLDGVVLDINDVERIDLRARGGSDTITIKNLAATDVKQVAIDLAGMTPGVGDGASDGVNLFGKTGNDTINVALVNNRVTVTGLAAQVTVANTEANDVISIDGGAGNDVINASTLAAGHVDLRLYGGAGNDRITGSKGNDDLSGNDGNDTVAGGKGSDEAMLGGGNDQYLWQVGDGVDFVDGEMGSDTLRVTASKASDALTISEDAFGRPKVYASNGSVATSDVERIELRALAGADRIDVFNITSAQVRSIEIDLAATAGGALADAHADTVIRYGADSDDILAVSWTGNKVVVDGLSAALSVAHAGTNDTIIVNGAVGDDVLNAAGMQAGKVRLQLDGYVGDDIIFGSGGNDTVIGGMGNDAAFMGAGNDRFIWNAGDGSDRVEGQAGTDTLVVNGWSANESFDIYENLDRLTFASGSAVVDLNGVERIQLRAMAGQDTVNVYQDQLSDTGLKQVAVDLGLADGTGDGKVDEVYVGGTNGDDQITIATAGSLVSVTGLQAQVTVAHAEALDLLTIGGTVGDDVINAAGVTAGVMQLDLGGGFGNDKITGSAGNDFIDGSQGNDRLDGGSGVDQLNGGDGDDVILGGLGDDFIDGSFGNDTLTGGGGSDTFYYNGVLDGLDVILDFDGDATGGQDRLNLDLLFDQLLVADGSRANLVQLTDNGGTVEVRVNADGNGANGFELHVATLHTTDAIAVHQDVVVIG
jgi:Ca2+-binding RTX toxin-like protein